MTDAPQEIEWPDEIWAEDRQDSHYGLYRLSVFATVNEPLEHAKYVHHKFHDSLQKYHDTMIASLRAELVEMHLATARISELETLLARCLVMDIHSAEEAADALGGLGRVFDLVTAYREANPLPAHDLESATGIDGDVAF